MDLALYDSRFGYYARAAQRSGRAGDFFTSVDVGAIFGTLLEAQIAEMADLLAGARSPEPAARFDLVEAGAGNGRLSADILRACRQAHPAVYARTALHLVEASPAARSAQIDTLGDMSDRLASSGAELPSSFDGVLVANELLDAMPVHQVVMREDGLKEIYVTVPASGSLEPDAPGVGPRRHKVSGAPRELDKGGAPRELAIVEGPPSTPALGEYLARLGVALEPGWRAEINLRAVEWIREAARRLRRGFLVLIDYGHEARDLYSVTHSSGTLTTFSRHVASGADRPSSAVPAWLERPGEQDITAHVDFTSVKNAAHDAGLTTLGFLDQTYFLMGILNACGMPQLDLRGRLALKTLVLPGGLGSTLKVLILGKGVGEPALSGCSYRMRVT